MTAERADWFQEDLQQLTLMREAKMQWDDIARQMSRRKKFDVTATACSRAFLRLRRQKAVVEKEQV